jgi:hypothetical protein
MVNAQDVHFLIIKFCTSDLLKWGQLIIMIYLSNPHFLIIMIDLSNMHK